MTEIEYLRMLDEVDRVLNDPAEAGRLLNDPAVTVDPAQIWSLLTDVFHYARLLNDEAGSDGGAT